MKNALMTSDRAPFLVRRKPGSNPELNTECRYATSRISSILKGSTKQFGWLQAPATNFWEIELERPDAPSGPFCFRLDREPRAVFFLGESRKQRGIRGPKVVSSLRFAQAGKSDPRKQFEVVKGRCQEPAYFISGSPKVR